MEKRLRTLTALAIVLCLLSACLTPAAAAALDVPKQYQMALSALESISIRDRASLAAILGSGVCPGV